MIGELMLLASALAAPNLGQLPGPRNDSAAHVELEVNTEGRVERCRLSEPASSKERAVQACSGLEGSLVTPARFSTGQPAPARLRATIGGVSPAVEPADLELATKGLPNGAKSLQTKVVLAVNNVGEVIDCQPTPAKTRSVLAQSACAALRQMAFPQMIGRSGRPLFYVTTQVVRFTAP